MAISFTAAFDVISQQLTLTDTRDYVGEGLLAGVGIFKVTDPLGNVIYENVGFASSSFATGDVIFGTNNTFSTILPASGGSIIEGTYTVEMKNQVTGSIVTELTQSYNYSNPNVTQDVDVSVNIDVPSVLIEDSTVYGAGSSVSRAWTVYYPASLGLADITSSAGSILLQNPTAIYTGGYEAKLISTVVYTVDADATLGTDGHTVNAVFDTIEKFTVDKSTLCEVYSCVLAMENHYQTLLDTDTNEAADCKPRLDHAIRLMNLIMAGIKCGEDVTSLYARLKAVYDNCACAADCACDPSDDDTPTLIASTNPALFNTVVTQGTGITVTPSVSGNTNFFNVAQAGGNTTTFNLTTNTPEEILLTPNNVGQAWAYRIDHAAPDAWQNISSFTDPDFAVITTENFLGSAFAPMRYRTERKYASSGNKSIVRISGSVRINRNSGSFLADDLFTLPGTANTRYRPEFTVEMTATLHTGLGTVPVGVIIRNTGQVQIEDPTDLSTLTPYSGSHFILTIERTFEGVEPIP